MRTTVWTTKFALGLGVLEVRGKARLDGTFQVEACNNMPGPIVLHPGEWFDTEMAALKEAHRLKEKKIVEAKKSLQRWKNLEPTSYPLPR